MGDRWKRAERKYFFFFLVCCFKDIQKIVLARPDEPNEDRRAGGFNRDRQNRGDLGRRKLI